MLQHFKRMRWVKTTARKANVLSHEIYKNCWIPLMAEQKKICFVLFCFVIHTWDCANMKWNVQCWNESCLQIKCTDVFGRMEMQQNTHIKWSMINSWQLHNSFWIEFCFLPFTMNNEHTPKTDVLSRWTATEFIQIDTVNE